MGYAPVLGKEEERSDTVSLLEVGQDEKTHWLNRANCEKKKRTCWLLLGSRGVSQAPDSDQDVSKREAWVHSSHRALLPSFHVPRTNFHGRPYSKPRSHLQKLRARERKVSITLA